MLLQLLHKTYRIILLLRIVDPAVVKEQSDNLIQAARNGWLEKEITKKNTNTIPRISIIAETIKQADYLSQVFVLL